MSSLYTKYRPSSFDQIKGNEDVVSVLTELVSDKESCPHAFLLHGQTGCGKTTIGRIIANMLECVGNDYKEVNMAEFRGIDTVREIIRGSQFKPMEGSCKVWVLDEIHKMTGDAANALLKILEEPPNHVYFILCTTEPQKLIETIRGRCSQFQLKPLDESQMYGLLRRIVHGEKAKLEKEIYDIIIRDSLGRPRNAIVILEQVLKASPERRAEVALQTAAQENQSIELCRALLKPVTWKEIIPILNGLKGQEAESIRRVILGYCQAILLKSDLYQAGRVLEQFIDPFYDSGFPQLVYACYTVIKTK
jgi:DNA polymerase-3 subunit gamma/tau